MKITDLQDLADQLIPHDGATVVRFAVDVGLTMSLDKHGVFVSDARQVDPAAPYGTTAIVLQDRLCLQRLCDPVGSLRSTLIHELGHHVDLAFHATPRRSSRPDAQDHLQVDLACPLGPIPAIPPWIYSCHCRRFVRATCHLIRRAELLGVDLDADDVLGLRGLWSGFSDGDAYRAAIGTEPDDHLNACLHDLLDTPEPADFAELWELDVSQWRPEDANCRVA